jgi:hypothetical protein
MKYGLETLGAALNFFFRKIIKKIKLSKRWK